MSEEETKQQPEKEVEEKEDLIVEKDGEIFVKQEADESSADEAENLKLDSDKSEQTGKGKSEVSEEKGEDDLGPAYRDKSVAEVARMHQEATKKITEQGEALGKLRKQTEKASLTTEELRERLSANELQVGLKGERVKLSRIDPVIDPEEYSKQQEIVTQLETDWLEKRQDEQIKQQLNSRDNQEFKIKQKDKFKDIGIELSDDAFEDLSDIAENYLVAGKYNEQAYQKALIDKYGVEKLTKFYTMSGEKKAREDIMNAEGKKTTKVDIKGSGKNAKLVRLHDLSPREMNKMLDKMTPEELNDLYSRASK